MNLDKELLVKMWLLTRAAYITVDLKMKLSGFNLMNM